MKIKWIYCETCECPTVLCPECGNNVCNGSNGKYTGGYEGPEDECPSCEKAYQIDMRFHSHMIFVYDYILGKDATIEIDV